MCSRLLERPRSRHGLSLPDIGWLGRVLCEDSDRNVQHKCWRKHCRRREFSGWRGFCSRWSPSFLFICVTRVAARARCSLSLGGLNAAGRGLVRGSEGLNPCTYITSYCNTPYVVLLSFVESEGAWWSTTCVYVPRLWLRGSPWQENVNVPRPRKDHNTLIVLP